MGGKKTKIPVADYLMSIQFGICKGRLDSFNKIFIKEKTVWCGRITDYEAVDVTLPKLFGGPKKEGGPEGVMELYLGTGDQIMSSEVASRYGKTPMTMPGYRGIGNIFFRGKLSGGFKWISNNPYLPGAWANVTRIPRQLSTSFAEIYANQEDSDGYTDVPVTVGYEDWKTFDLATLGIADEAVDEGRVKFQANWRIQTSIGASPLVKTEGEFYDGPSGSGALVSDYESTGGAGDPPYVTHNSFQVLPVGTRSVRVRYSAEFFGGFFTEYDEDYEASFFRIEGGGPSVTHCAEDSLGRLPDANPAHMLYELLTDRDWGMGASPSAVDVDSFMYSAELFFNEKFGLSIIWTQSTDIQSYASEILDHVQANLFIDPRTGLWTLVPLRGDYDIETLPILNPDNCKATNRQRKALGETVNEIVVTWTNPNNEKEESLTFQDGGSIAANDGEIISAARNYYGVRNSELAGRLGMRDLRAASYPMFGCDIVANRSMSFLRPGSVAKFNWPEDGIVDMIVRVGKVDYGRPGESSVKFPVTEDVFGLDVGTYTGAQTGLWQNPSVPPTPMTYTTALTPPLPLLLRSGVDLIDVSDDDYPSVFVGVLSDHVSPSVEYFDLHGPLVRPTGETYTDMLGSLLPTPSSALTTTWEIEAETTISEEEIRALAFPRTVEPGDFLYLTNSDSEVISEIVMLDVLAAGEWTVARGMFDTIPRRWAAGSRLWFIGDDVSPLDPSVQTSGVEIDYFLLPTTSGGTLDISDAPLFNFTPSDRPYLPFRPANVGFTPVGGVPLTPELPLDPGMVVPLQYFVADIPTDLEVAWEDRNRMSEDVVAARWDAGAVTPEIGQSTTVRLVDLDTDTVLSEDTGLTSSPHTFSLSALPGLGRFAVEVVAVRDGFESLQNVAQRIMVIEPGYGNAYGFAYAD